MAGSSLLKRLGTRVELPLSQSFALVVPGAGLEPARPLRANGF